jgi:inner membrane protein
MNPLTHLFIGWLVAETRPELSSKDRFIVTMAGVVPDIDGTGALAEIVTRNTGHSLLWYSQYHHILHNALFSFSVAAIALFLSDKRLLAGLMSLLTIHIHLLCDILGAKGPDGDQWPIPYLLPFNKDIQLAWRYQWELNAWPNFLITGIAIIMIIFLARRRGYSIVSLFSRSADRVFVNTIRARFPLKS